MKRMIVRTVFAAMILVGFGTAIRLFVQGKLAREAASGPGYETTEEMRRLPRMGEIVQGISEQTSRMQQKIQKGDMKVDVRTQISEQLSQMSELMRCMSRLIDRSSMKGPDMDKQVKEVRGQMDRMGWRHGGAPFAALPPGAMPTRVADGTIVWSLSAAPGSGQELRKRRSCKRREGIVIIGETTC